MKGHLAISRRHDNGSDKDYVNIVVEDEASHRNFIEVKIDLEKFAQALLGLSYQSCEFRLTNLDLVGRVREHKTEVVWVPDGGYLSGSWRDREDILQKLLEPYEKEGWKAYRSDLTNYHNSVKGYEGNRLVDLAKVAGFGDDAEFGHAQRVTFTRYVEPRLEK